MFDGDILSNLTPEKAVELGIRSPLRYLYDLDGHNDWKSTQILNK